MDNQGKLFRDEGIERVEMNNPEFVSAMRLVALQHAQKHGTVTADDLRAVASERGIEPLHPNAWGSVFNTPALKPVGFTHSKTPSCHARVIRVWTLA